MAQVLRQRQWRSTISLLAMVAWLLGTNFCALGLMAQPCGEKLTDGVDVSAAVAVALCPHCLLAKSDTPPADRQPATPLCCQEVRAEFPPASVTLSPMTWFAVWTPVWVEALSSLVEIPAGAGSASADTGPPVGEGAVALRVLLGRCAPVHAPPLLG